MGKKKPKELRADQDLARVWKPDPKQKPKKKVRGRKAP